MPINLRDLRVGLLFAGVGIAFGLHAYWNLRIGTPSRMGPGFFPLALSVLLVVLGAVIVLKSAAAAPSAPGRISWRGLSLVLLAPIFFGLTINGLGFVPTVAGAALIAALASSRTGLPRALCIAAGLTALCVVIFIYGVGIPTPLFGPWVGG